MSGRKRPVFKSQGLAVACGVASLAFAAWCFRDAYEHRGKNRPLIVSWIGV